MKKFLLTALVLCAMTAMMSAIGCNDGKDRNDDTGQSEKQDRLDATSGKPPQKP